MLWIIAAVLLILWLFGVVASFAFGGFIHVLLVVGVSIVLIRLIRGKKVV